MYILLMYIQTQYMEAKQQRSISAVLFKKKSMCLLDAMKNDGWAKATKTYKHEFKRQLYEAGFYWKEKQTGLPSGNSLIKWDEIDEERMTKMIKGVWLPQKYITGWIDGLKSSYYKFTESKKMLYGKKEHNW